MSPEELARFTGWYLNWVNEELEVGGEADCRVRTNKVHQAKWAAAKTSCGPEQRS